MIPVMLLEMLVYGDEWALGGIDAMFDYSTLEDLF